MSAITRLSALRALACLLTGLTIGSTTGCTGGSGDITPPAPAEATATIGLVERPHFAGTKPVTLHVGRTVYSAADCPSSEQSDRVCDPDDGREYLLVGDPGDARLVEAQMDPADGNTAWSVTVSFSRDSAGRLRRFREQARATGGTVLVLDETGSTLLVNVPVTRVEGRTMVLPGLAKPEAWSLVERITAE